MEATRSASLTDRMKGAALLDVPTYEEVEHDRTATGQAAVVVGIVALASAIGSLGAGFGGFVMGILAAFIGWLAWSGITYLVGANLFGGTATWGELLRTIGFAQSPGVLAVFGIIPILGALVRLVLFFWIVVAVVIAIRQALDFSTGKAILTALIGGVVYIAISVVLGLLLGLPMAAVAA